MASFRTVVSGLLLLLFAAVGAASPAHPASHMISNGSPGSTCCGE